MPSGGYRRPANPAPVSGPGALSRRTDGKQPVMSLPDAAYGEDQTFREAQQGAPLPQAANVTPQPPPIIPLGAPSAQPDVPVTNGAEYGPGAGASAIGGAADPLRADAADMAKYLPVLFKMADNPDTPRGTKQWLRTILANLP